MNICKDFSWQDDWLVTIWDSKILLGCNRVTRHCWFWAAIQILRFTEHSSYGHWLKEKTRENQNRKRNLFLFSPSQHSIWSNVFCHIFTWVSSLFVVCWLPISIQSPLQSKIRALMFKLTKENLPGSVALTLKVIFSLSVALHRHTRVSGNILVFGWPVSGL